MDNILDSLTILGESKNNRPTYYYRAVYFIDQPIFYYIEKAEKAPKNTVIIEVNEHFNMAKTNSEYVNAVIKYLRNQAVW